MRLKFLLPVLVFVAIAGIMWYALFNLDPTKIPSELIAKPAPEFALEPVPDFGPGLATADLKKGKVTLVNVFASWCISCIAEHPLLVKFAAENPVEIYGLDYKDKPDAAAEWLRTRGNPYKRTGMDLKGRVGIDFGVYGVPETFIIDGNGMVVDKIIGPVNEDIIENRLKPLLKKLGS